MKHLFQLTLIFLFTFSYFTIQAQTAKLSIQGILRSPNGSAVENGTYEVKFKLYTSFEGGVAIWEDTFDDVDVIGGVYSVTIGSGAELNVPFDQPYFLGVSVDGGSELIPRAGLTSSPYALSLIGSDNKFPNSGNVGIGSAAPGKKLTIQRGDGILGLEAIEDANNTSTITTTATGMEFDAGGTDKAYVFSNGRIQATADEFLTIEGTTDANIVFTKTTGSATLGFDNVSGEDLKLINPLGATHIEGNNITLNTSNGTATIEGAASVKKNGETLKLIGTDTSFLSFYPNGLAQGRKAYFGFKDGNEYLSLKNETSNTSEIRIESFVRMTGVKPIEICDYDFIQEYGGFQQYPWCASPWLNLYADHIRSYIFYADSDQRIKKDFRSSNGIRDLETLNQIEVTDYKHKDVVNLGTDFKKGFIAQQVKEIFPEAVNITSGEIPNIYEFPESIYVENGKATFILSKPHELSIGDHVKLIFGTEEKYFPVVDIKESTSFSIENWDGGQNPKEVFIFGKKINDFHVVDYDRVFTLNVSATQELARKVEALEKALAKSEQSNHRLKADLNEMNTRLEKLESVLTATGSK